MATSTRRAQGRAMSKVLYKSLLERIRSELKIEVEHVEKIGEIIQDVLNFDPQAVDARRNEQKKAWEERNKDKVKLIKEKWAAANKAKRAPPDA
jgi:hypothetical protein